MLFLLFGECVKGSRTDPVCGMVSRVKTEEEGTEFILPLKELIQTHGLNVDKLNLAFPLPEEKQPRPRNEIFVTDKEKTVTWQVPSLRGLWRGDEVPEAMRSTPPEKYIPHFTFMEIRVLGLFDVNGRLSTDQELEEIYSNIRRRPDGRSLGWLHDNVWRIAAFMLGTHVVSEAEFTAIFGRLEQSVRTFAMRPVSRNYGMMLSEHFGGE